MQRLTRSAQGVAGRGRKDLSGEILKRHYFFVVLDYCFEVQSSLLVAAATGLRKRVCRRTRCDTTPASTRMSQRQQPKPGWARKPGPERDPKRDPSRIRAACVASSSEHAERLEMGSSSGLRKETQGPGRSHGLLKPPSADTAPGPWACLNQTQRAQRSRGLTEGSWYTTRLLQRSRPPRKITRIEKQATGQRRTPPPPYIYLITVLVKINVMNTIPENVRFIFMAGARRCSLMYPK